LRETIANLWEKKKKRNFFEYSSDLRGDKPRTSEGTNPPSKRGKRDASVGGDIFNGNVRVSRWSLGPERGENLYR